MRLLTLALANPKTAKDADRYHGAILHLAPHTDGAPDGLTVCPMAERSGCAVPCLAFQGRARVFLSIREARRRKTARFFSDRAGFMADLRADLVTLQRGAERAGKRAVARLDGTSDLGLAETLRFEFPGIMFYDYTKVTARIARWRAARDAGCSENWYLTYSAGAPTTALEIRMLVARGVNVAVPFAVRRGAELPATYAGVRVVDGDASDARFADPLGVVVGLRAKGTSAALDAAGFVRRV